ncbi:MAG: pyridoxal phosphate-dependent aminotransferase [Salinivirgaceae bacterium]
MIPVKSSNTTQSSIVAMGTRLAQAMKETGLEYLMLNRGVNSVVTIELTEVIKSIDFNSTDIQVYPATNGKMELLKAINQEYFANQASVNNILVTGGGISGLDISLQNIQVKKVLLPALFWGTYSQLLSLRGISFESYPNYKWLAENTSKLSGTAVIICDPGNPAGEKYPDAQLLELIQTLNKNGVIVLFDSPYRRLFYNHLDTLFQELMNLEHVIIIESFSKSLGLSGQRIGFIHNTQQSFMNEAALRLMYATNGVNSFAQVLVTRLLATLEGIKAVNDFKKVTTEHIAANIAFLKENQLLANQFYQDSKPLGIFAIVNHSPEELFQQRIGSVGLDYFTLTSFEGMENLSRILVSYPHEKFVSFFRCFS